MNREIFPILAIGWDKTFYRLIKPLLMEDPDIYYLYEDNMRKGIVETFAYRVSEDAYRVSEEISNAEDVPKYIKLYNLVNKDTAPGNDAKLRFKNKLLKQETFKNIKNL